ncbi:immunoglobulin superfamily member 6-like [Heptranchias perlo]|uniref:immunoglobulin superfamily member 6-like n=1 Tax=Heptranchias perlo TaxID=212740 RepID=UPI00355A03B6
MALPIRFGKILLLFHQAVNLHIAGFAAQNCNVTVNQEPFIERYSTDNLTIPCKFTGPGCSGHPKIQWFRISSNKGSSLCLGACSNTGSPGKFHLHGLAAQGDATLRIQQVDQLDSGVYYCGVAYHSTHIDKSKQTGSGTTLVVRASGLLITAAESWLHATLTIVLSLYTIGITIVLVQTTHLTRKADSHRNHSSSTPNEDEKSRAFQALALEFNRKYRSENQETNFEEEQTDYDQNDDSIYQNA